MKTPAFILALCLLGSIQMSVGQTTNSDKPINTNTVSYIASQLKASNEVVYKEIDGQSLKLHIYNPPGFKTNDARPCFLIIHGGGWVGGNARIYAPFAAHFAELGMVGISIDYRLMKKGSGITPFECVKDGRSAVRYVRKHATELGIDPKKLIVSGGSAGGHVAACTACCQGIDEKTDDLSISCLPDAMVLYWPVLDTSKAGYGNAKCGDHWEEISPVNLVRLNLPPALVFHGTGDHTVPVKGSELFHDAMLKAGNRCELVIEPGGEHGYMTRTMPLFNQGMHRTEEFLKSAGLLK